MLPRCSGKISTPTRTGWIEETKSEAEKKRREKTTFLDHRDESGRVVDFHALRHTFVTNLVRGGAHPKVVQDLARHSTITLTMDRYTHSVLGDQVDALSALPALVAKPADQSPPSAATGTEG